MGILRSLSARQDLVLVALMVLTIMMMILPVPTVLADALIAVDIAISFVLLMMAIYVGSPTEFSTLPTVILLTTAFRLSISITTSRLVLVQGDAGLIIRTFGDFVIAGNVVVGLVVYLIITIVQFVVITKGSERVAEVAARFTLDALPGKQISIDTDLRNGDIDQHEARRRRGHLEKESQLYGAMDGAMKFVKGDAIASLVIIAVNLVGGMAIGCLQRGLPFLEAVQTYSLLAVGDGLIAQVPALLVSLTAGVIVTRVTSANGGNLGQEVIGQFTANARPLQIGSAALCGLALIPGFPAAIFLALGAGLGVGSWLLCVRKRKEARHAFNAEAQAGTSGPEAAVLQVVIGNSLMAELSEIEAALEGMRQALQVEMGIRIPQLRVVPGPAEARRVAVLVDGIAVSEAAAEDPGALATFVRQTMLRCAGQFVGIQETQALVLRMEAQYGDLVREAGKAAPLPRLAEVLRRLVDEQVPVANLRRVLEAVAEWGPREAAPAILADHVRIGLSRQICHRWASTDKVLDAVLVEGAVDELLRAAVRSNPAGGHLALDPGLAASLVAEFQAQLAQARPDRAAKATESMVVVTAFDVRRHLRTLLLQNGLDLPVLSHQELSPEFKVRAVGSVGMTRLRSSAGSELLRRQAPVAA